MLKRNYDESAARNETFIVSSFIVNFGYLMRSKNDVFSARSKISKYAYIKLVHCSTCYFLLSTPSLNKVRKIMRMSEGILGYFCACRKYVIFQFHEAIENSQ